MHRKSSRNNFEPIGDIIHAALNKWMNTSGAPIFKIWTIWDIAVGEDIAKYAQPVRLERNILTVHVSDSVWMHQLRFSKTGLVEKINSAAGGFLVSDIKFKIRATTDN